MCETWLRSEIVDHKNSTVRVNANATFPSFLVSHLLHFKTVNENVFNVVCCISKSLYKD